MKQYLLAAPAPAIVHETDKATGKVIGVLISAIRGYEMALQSVTQGPKLFEVWALRKRFQEVMFEDGNEDARYVVLTADEKELLLQAVKTIDWTFGQKLNFWTTWNEFLDSFVNIPEFDEKNPPLAYVEWKKAFDARRAAVEAERKAAEARVLAEKEAKENARKAAVAAIFNTLAQAALEEKISEGKLGQAATADDLPAGLVAELQKEAETRYATIEAAAASVPPATDAPAAPAAEAPEATTAEVASETSK